MGEERLVDQSSSNPLNVRAKLIAIDEGRKKPKARMGTPRSGVLDKKKTGRREAVESMSKGGGVGLKHRDQEMKALFECRVGVQSIRPLP